MPIGKKPEILVFGKELLKMPLIMNIDDLICVGAVDNILVSSTIGRNKRLIPGEVIAAIINGTEELLQQLREMGIGAYATGGETADVGDLVRTIIVDSTVTCRMPRAHVINNENISGGDVIVGLASFGRATYESEYNGGDGKQWSNISKTRCLRSLPGRKNTRKHLTMRSLMIWFIRER